MNHAEKGFTLVEMAIVIMIMGLVVGSVFSFLSVQQEEKKQQLTITRQQKIATALASFAQLRGVLPCPSKPEDALGVNYGIAPVTCTTNILRNGIIPFRTLGLTEQDIVDGYNNPFTYSVAEDASTIPPATPVHEKCRLNTTSSWTASGANANPGKARFCCQQNDGAPLNVYRDISMTPTTRVVSPIQTGIPSTRFQPVDTVASTASPDVLTYFAYVIVSHGNDGAGSYTLCQPGATSSNCNNTRKDLSAAGTGESENANDDGNFVTLPLSNVDGPDHFDDIVLWRTQERVISELNNDSCAVP